MTYDEPVSISFYLPALQHAQSYLQSSSASDDSLAPLPNSFTEGVDGDGDAEPDSSPRLGKRPQQPEPTSSIDDLRSGAFVYVKEPKGDCDLDNFITVGLVNSVFFSRQRTEYPIRKCPKH